MAAPIGPDATAAVLRQAAADEPLWLAVSGSSMAPSLAGGARVRVEPRPVPPRAGSIWAFCNASGLVVVHRCVAPGADASSFRGDSHLRRDPPVPHARLIGEVVAVDHGGRVDPVAGRAPTVAARLGRTVVRRVRRWAQRSS